MADKPNEAPDKKPADGAPQEGAHNKPDTAPDQGKDTVPWKELLDAERTGRLAAERDRDSYQGGIKRLTKENARLRRGDATVEDDDEEEEQPITRKDLKNVVENLSGQNRAESILNSMIADPDKRALVKDIFENRIRRTGTSDEAIRADVEAAIGIADSKRISKENSELKRMNDNRVYVPPVDGGGGGGGGRPAGVKAHEWTPQQEAALEQRAQSIGLFGESVEKYKESAWREFQGGTAFAVKPKPKN